MPDLSLRASHDYWKNYHDPMIYRTITFMESMENWTIDGDPKIEAAMEKLGQNLENVTNFELVKEDHYIKIANFLA